MKTEENPFPPFPTLGMSSIRLGYYLAELARLLLVYSQELCAFNFESLKRDEEGTYSDYNNDLVHIEVIGSRWLPRLRALISRYSQMILVKEHPELDATNDNQTELHAFCHLASPTQLAKAIKKLCDQITLEGGDNLLEKIGQLDGFLADHQASCRALWEKAAAEAYFNGSSEYPSGYHSHA